MAIMGFHCRLWVFMVIMGGCWRLWVVIGDIWVPIDDHGFPMAIS